MRPLRSVLALPLLLPLALLAGACGHTETHVAVLRPAEAPTGRPAELYLADQASPTRPYYELALVQAVGFGSDATAEDVVRGLTAKAEALGCDAVVRTFVDVGYSRAHAAGVCVKYLAPGPPGPPPVLPPSRGKNPPPPPMRPAPSPRIDPLPSAPNQGR
jgi:hypothetical protein